MLQDMAFLSRARRWRLRPNQVCSVALATCRSAAFCVGRAIQAFTALAVMTRFSARGAGANDQPVGQGDVGRIGRPPAQDIDERIDGTCPDGRMRLRNGSQGRLAVASHRDIVETNDRHILRACQTCGPDGTDCTDRHFIAEAE
jgi:hypothetical protein